MDKSESDLLFLERSVELEKREIEIFLRENQHLVDESDILRKTIDLKKNEARSLSQKDIDLKKIVDKM